MLGAWASHSLLPLPHSRARCLSAYGRQHHLQYQSPFTCVPCLPAPPPQILPDSPRPAVSVLLPPASPFLSLLLSTFWPFACQVLGGQAAQMNFFGFGCSILLRWLKTARGGTLLYPDGFRARISSITELDPCSRPTEPSVPPWAQVSFLAGQDRR